MYSQKMSVEQKYLKKLFHAYYKNNVKNLIPPTSLPQREFAFLLWDRKGMMRHLMFPTYHHFIQELVLTSPRHAYHSAAYYTSPSADTMDKKGYIGCDLVFDIDADHIPTECRKKHNYVTCQQCGTRIMGDKPEVCPHCGSKKFDKFVWICDECLEASKKQVIHLIENFLLREFNIPLEDIDIYFSGHRGYHVHIENEKFHKLDQNARREIVDYITGEGFSFKQWNFGRHTGVMRGFHVDQVGWPGKIARELYNVLMSGPEGIRETFKNEIHSQQINLLIANRHSLLQKLRMRDKIWEIKKISEKTWYKIFHVLKERIKADIDVVVTIDTHRLIRLANSLHGKTGFVVKKLEYEELLEFNPLRNAFAFSHSHNQLNLTITSEYVPSIILEEEEYGPYEYGEKIQVPLNVAIFFLTKEVATLQWE